MPNLDFPDVCLSETDYDCSITPPDLAATRERVHKLPEGMTKVLVKNLQMAFPDKLKSEEDAYMIFDAMKAVIATALHNKNPVHLEGLGEFQVEQQGGKPTVAFTPESALVQVLQKEK